MTLEEKVERFQVRKLNMHEQVLSFDCGDEDLNDFILNDSPLYRKELLAVSYVLEEKETKRVVAYFSLANDRVSISDFPDNNTFNRFRKKRFVNQKRIKSYPAAKICRLAVSNGFKGLTLGTWILNFLKSYLRVENKTGCRFLTVDAYLAAIPFYEKNRFAPLTTKDSNSNTRLLFYDLASNDSDE
jgi:GNAT superfamily N-acetyltransferase